MQSEEPVTTAAQNAEAMRTMKSEEAKLTAPKRRGKELSPLGAMLKGLQVDEHIVIDYPEDAMPTMAAAIKHYRSIFKMNLLYRLTAPGRYDIWRATVDFERKSKLFPLGEQLKNS